MERVISRGNISMVTTIVGAIGMVIASAFTAWASSSQAVAEVKTEVSVTSQRENDHYAEIQKQLDTMNKKLDTLVTNQSALTARTIR